MQKVSSIVLTLMLFIFIGCKSHYSYSSQPPIKPVATKISSIGIAEFKGINVDGKYRGWFDTYLSQALAKKSFIELNEASLNRLHVNVNISPASVKRYRDIDIFKNKVYVIDTDIILHAEYKLVGADGIVICADTYVKTKSSSSSSTGSYEDANRARPLHVIQKEMMQSMTKTIASKIIDNTKVP
jgi:hypothetical protein